MGRARGVVEVTPVIVTANVTVTCGAEGGHGRGAAMTGARTNKGRRRRRGREGKRRGGQHCWWEEHQLGSVEWSRRSGVPALGT